MQFWRTVRHVVGSVGSGTITLFTQIYVTMVTIAHNHVPDQFSENIPEMTFISFSARFVGQLGLLALAVLHFLLRVN